MKCPGQDSRLWKPGPFFLKQCSECDYIQYIGVMESGTKPLMSPTKLKLSMVKKVVISIIPARRHEFHVSAIYL